MIPILCIDCEKLFDPKDIETHHCTNTQDQRVAAGRGGNVVEKKAEKGSNPLKEEDSELNVN